MEIINKIFVSLPELKQFLNGFEKNKFCMIQIFAGLDDEILLKKIIKTVNSHFENSILLGLTTAGEIYNKEILTNHILISFVFTDKKVVFKEFNLNSVSSKEAGKEISKLITQHTSFMIVYGDTFKFNPDEFLKPLNALEYKPEIFGSLAADNGNFLKSKVFSKKRIYKHGLVVALVENTPCTEKNITKYISSQSFFYITKFDKNRVYSINNRNSHKCFSKFFGKSIEQSIPKSTFAIPIMFDNIPRTILKVNKRYVTLIGNVLSKKASFGLPNVTDVISTLKETLKNMEKKKFHHSFVTFSYGKKLIMQDEIRHILNSSGIKFVGFIGYGEFTKEENRYVFVTNSISILGFKTEKKVIFNDTVTYSDESVTKQSLFKTTIKIISELHSHYEKKQRVLIKKYQKSLSLQRLFYAQFNEIYTKEILALLAHQLRQPLNAISISMSNLYLNSQLNNITPEEIKKSAYFIQNQCLDMSHKINSFFFINKNNTRISNIFENIKEIISIQLYNRKIDFNVDVKNDFQINGDVSLFNSAIIGILFYLRDELKKVKNKKLSVTVLNESIRIYASVTPELKNIFSSNTKDAKMLISKNILTQEYGMDFKIEINDGIIIKITKRG